MTREFLTTSQLAKLLGVSRIAVFKKIKKGEIKAVRIGRNYAVDKKLVDELLGQKLSNRQKQLIKRAVKKTVREYPETLRLLGQE